MTFVRQKSDGSVCQVFSSVDFLVLVLVIWEDVLLMNGDLGIFYDSVGVLSLGGFGTLIKGMSIPAGDGPVTALQLLLLLQTAAAARLLRLGW